MKFPAFHGTRWFITVLTSVRHLSLSWTSPIQSIYPHPTSWRSILILSNHLRLGLPSGLLPSDFPTKTLYTPLSPTRATCPAYLILLDFITRTIMGVCYLLHQISVLTSAKFFITKWIRRKKRMNSLVPKVCVTIIKKWEFGKKTLGEWVFQCRMLVTLHAFSTVGCSLLYMLGSL